WIALFSIQTFTPGAISSFTLRSLSSMTLPMRPDWEITVSPVFRPDSICFCRLLCPLIVMRMRRMGRSMIRSVGSDPPKGLDGGPSWGGGAPWAGWPGAGAGAGPSRPGMDVGWNEYVLNERPSRGGALH